MQNRYSGDVGDFGKYGFLRSLSGGRQLGVVWYLYPDERGNEDGRFVEYLDDNRFRECDPELFDRLRELVCSGRRNVTSIEASLVLGRNTRFFSEELDFSHFTSRGFTPQGRAERIAYRDDWLSRAIRAMETCEIIFLDPDNGLEVPSIQKHEKKGPKFVYMDELRAFLTIPSVKAVILYHHLNRHRNYGTHERQMQDRSAEIAQAMNGEGCVSCVRFQPYSPRAFFVVSRNQTDARPFVDAVKSFAQSSWRMSFTQH